MFFLHVITGSLQKKVSEEYNRGGTQRLGWHSPIGIGVSEAPKEGTAAKSLRKSCAPVT